MKKHPLTFIIAAGGTGGHMFPAEALKTELVQRGYNVILFSDRRGASVPGVFEGVETHLIESGTFASKTPVGLFKSGWRLFAGFLRATSLMFKKGPVGVIGFGGYPVLPAIAAARFLTIPYCLHEQNAVLGRANRLMAPKARAIALSFAKTRKVPVLKRLQTKVTGNPVRPAILKVGAKPYPAPAGGAPFNLLVFGGSQGARVFSDVVPEALGLLPTSLKARLRVSQQCRREDIARVKSAYQKAGIKAEILEFFKDIPARLEAANLVISRGGATSLFEFAGAARPAILVPLPGALDDHQGRNAKIMADAGAAWLFREDGFTATTLAEKIKTLADNPASLERAARAAHSLSHPEAVQKLADLVENMAVPKRERAGAKTRKGQNNGPTNTFKRAAA